MEKAPMRQLSHLLLLAALVVIAPRVEAAQPTELIPFLHMDAEVGYAGGIQFGRLREQDTDTKYHDVAKYTHHRHEMDIDIEFGVCPMLELDLRFPIIFQDRLHYRSANDLSYNVSEERATMLGGYPLPSEELIDFKRGGFGDMEIGLQFSPFNESYDKNPAPATMLIEFTFLAPTGGDRYEVDSSGTAKPGNGGPGIRVGAAFSKRVPGGEPYFWARYELTGRYDANLINSSGEATYGGPATLNPADSIQVMLGTEIYAMNNPTSATAINVDLYGGFSYHSWADIEAGSILPVTHNTTEGHLATTSEYLVPHFGLGLYIRPTPMVQIRLNTGLDYETSHIVERVDMRNYEIATGMDTLRINFGITVVGSFARPDKNASAASSPIP